MYLVVREEAAPLHHGEEPVGEGVLLGLHEGLHAPKLRVVRVELAVRLRAEE